MGTAHLLKLRRLILRQADPLDFLLDKRSGRDDLFAGPQRLLHLRLSRCFQRLAHRPSARIRISTAQRPIP